MLPGEFRLVASEVSISGSLEVNRTTKLELVDDMVRAEIEVLVDDIKNFLVGHFSSTIGIDVD